MDFRLSPAEKRNGEGKENSIFLPGPRLLLCVGTRFVPTTPCMTQMPSGPFLYSMYPVCVWAEALPDIKGRIWRYIAFAVSISELQSPDLLHGSRIPVNFTVLTFINRLLTFPSFLLRSGLHKRTAQRSLLSLSVEILP